MTRGRPTTAKSKNRKGCEPASTAALDTMTLTGLPVRARREPALPANAIGISISDGERLMRVARTSTMGSRAATDPLSVMTAVRTAHRPSTATVSRTTPSPTTSMRRCPAQVVTPVESMASLTTKRDAMKTTTGSPKPERAVGASTRPVA